jgi:hypothetical protein
MKKPKKSTRNLKAIKAKSAYDIWYIPVKSGNTSTRYAVVILTEDDPVRLGCELPLNDCRRVTREFNMMLKLYILGGNDWFGGRKTIIKINMLLHSWRTHEGNLL